MLCLRGCSPPAPGAAPASAPVPAAQRDNPRHPNTSQLHERSVQSIRLTPRLDARRRSSGPRWRTVWDRQVESSRFGDRIQLYCCLTSAVPILEPVLALKSSMGLIRRFVCVRMCKNRFYSTNEVNKITWNRMDEKYRQRVGIQSHKAIS